MFQSSLVDILTLEFSNKYPGNRIIFLDSYMYLHFLPQTYQPLYTFQANLPLSKFHVNYVKAFCSNRKWHCHLCPKVFFKKKQNSLTQDLKKEQKIIALDFSNIWNCTLFHQQQFPVAPRYGHSILLLGLGQECYIKSFTDFVGSSNPTVEVSTIFAWN